MISYSEKGSLINWTAFEIKSDDPPRDFEALCRSLVRLALGGDGEFIGYKQQSGVEFIVKVNRDNSTLGGKGTVVGWQWLERVKSDRLSLMYELLGLIWLPRDLRRSFSYLRLAVEYDYKNSTALNLLAQLYFNEKNDYAQALECANQSFAYLPEDTSEEMVRDVMTIQYFCYALKRDYLRAREIILNIDKELTVSWLIGNKAYLSFKCEDYTSAEELAAKALKMNPEEGSALNTMGMLALHRGQYTHAIRHFKAALRTSKKGKCGSEDRYFYCELCNNCAVAYYENHDEESAKEWFDKALDAGCLHVDMRRYDALAKTTNLIPLQKSASC